MDKYYVGTEMKLKLGITCTGFDMDTDPWTATVKSKKGTVTCTKEEHSAKSGDDWFILVDTGVLGTGQYVLIIEIDVPDNDFDDGYRHEVYKRNLVNVEKV